MTLKPLVKGGKINYSRLYCVNSENILLDSSVTKMFIEKYLYKGEDIFNFNVLIKYEKCELIFYHFLNHPKSFKGTIKRER
jgi:hypothetical protein